MKLKLYSPEVLVLIDLWQWPEVRSQVLPAIAFHQHRTILQSNQLWDIDPCAGVVKDTTVNLRESASHVGVTLLLLSHWLAAAFYQNVCPGWRPGNTIELSSV